MIKALGIICLYLVLATATGCPIDDTTTTTRKSGIIIINPATPTRTSRTTQSTTPKPDSEFVDTGISYAALTVFKELNLVATGRESKAVLIYDLNTRELVRTIEDFSYGMVPFKQNQLILASLYGHISFWNVETGELVRTIEHNFTHFQAMAINKKQNLLLTGGLNRNVIMWDLINFKQIRTFEKQLRIVQSLAFMEDKNQVIAGYDNGNITVWNMYDGSHIRTFNAGSSDVNKLVVDEETGLLYSVSNDGIIREWDVDSGTVLKTFTGTGTYSQDLIFSEDNERLISAAKHKLTTWSKQSGKIVTELNSVSELYNLAINPLNGQLLSTSQNRRLTFWSVKL